MAGLFSTTYTTIQSGFHRKKERKQKKQSRSKTEHMDYRPIGCFIFVATVWITYLFSPRISASFPIRLMFLIFGLWSVHVMVLIKFEYKILNPSSQCPLPSLSFTIPNKWSCLQYQHWRNAQQRNSVYLINWSNCWLICWLFWKYITQICSGVISNKYFHEWVMHTFNSFIS